MTGPSLQKTALLSFSLHLTAFLLILLVLRQSNHIEIPSPYTVNLVSTDVLTKINRGKNEDILKKAEEAAAPSETGGKSEREKAKERELVEKKIAALQQKEKVEERISGLEEKKKRIAELQKHHQVISVKAAAGKHDGDSRIISTGRGSIFDDYYAKIKSEMEQQWRPPDIGRKDIEAIVSVKISKDGTAVVQRMEKSSGNVLFDRSVRLAIAKANPLSRPPYEMEIGVRFHP